MVLHTEDGGRNWVDQVADLEGEFPWGEWGWKIQFLSDQVGFVSLENFKDGAILQTADAGKSWKRVKINVTEPQPNVNLEGVGFLGDEHGWVGGWGDASFETGFTSVTTDGGRVWLDATSQVGEFINRFRFLGDPVTVGYASGETIYRFSAEPPRSSPEILALPAVRLLERVETTDSAHPVHIQITVPEDASRVAVNLWDRFAKHQRQLLDEARPEAGSRSLEWDLTDDAGRSLGSGYFVLRVTVDGHSESQIVTVKP